MGFKDFWKKVFSGDEQYEADLRAARAKHGIVIDEKKAMEEEEREKEPYDPWEEVSAARTTFFFGRWATRKFRVVGEEKVKAELEALDKKRQEEGKR